MQFSNIILSAIVSYIGICDANYQIVKPTPTPSTTPSYPTANPGYPTQPTNNNNLYFVCNLNNGRAKQGLKPLSVADSFQPINQLLAARYTSMGYQDDNLFDKFQQAGLSLSKYTEMFYSGYPSLDAVADSLTSDKNSHLYNADFDVVSLSYNNGVASIILGASADGNKGYIPVCQGYPTKPEQPKQTPQYPTQPEQPQQPPQKPEQPQQPPQKPEQPQQPPKKPEQPSNNIPAGDEGKKCLCLVNAFRAANGKGPLYWSDKLARASQAHSQDMKNTDNLSHTGSNGSQLGQRIQDNGFKWSGAAENIANGQASYVEAQKGWEDSQYHRDNLLGDYSFFGYGQSAGQGKYYTQNFAGAISDEAKIQVQC